MASYLLGGGLGGTSLGWCEQKGRPPPHGVAGPRCTGHRGLLSGALALGGGGRRQEEGSGKSVGRGSFPSVGRRVVSRGVCGVGT